MIIKDNFLNDTDLAQLDKLFPFNSPWYLQKEQVTGADDGCWLAHTIYEIDEPRSSLYKPVIDIFRKYLEYISLCRIIVNLLLRQEKPSISDFHTDYRDSSYVVDEAKITTAIFYLNTNNGATEIKGVDRIDAVRNRLIMFPATTLHRAIGQTDTNTRVVFNFNFIA